jgi:hypothetical protein
MITAKIMITLKRKKKKTLKIFNFKISMIIKIIHNKNNILIKKIMKMVKIQ